MSAYGPNSYYAQNLKMGRKGNDMGTGSAWDNPGGRQQMQGAPMIQPQQPQQKQGSGGIFGGLKSAFGGLFGGGGKFNPMMNQSKFNPMNLPGLSQARNTMFGNPQQQQKPPTGIGPSMGAFGGMMGGKMGMKPPGGFNTGFNGGQPGMNYGEMKPPMERGPSPDQYQPEQPYYGQRQVTDPNAPFYDSGWGGGGRQQLHDMGPNNIGGQQGLGPSMQGMQQMLQQPEQMQQPAAAGPMPDFGQMGQFGGQPMNRGYGRM